jgi:diguanylate cyclase (GGDEF)-like protein
MQTLNEYSSFSPAEETSRSPVPLPAFSHLAAASRLANQDAPLETVLPELAAEAAAALGADAGWITLLDPCGGHARVHYAFGLPEVSPLQYPLADSPDSRILEQDHPLQLEMAEFADHEVLQRLGMSTLAGAPLISGGQTYGTLKILFRLEMELSGEQLALLGGLATQTASAVRFHCQAVEIRKLTITDPLTGLYNQSYFLEIAAQELQRARRYEHPFSLLLVDIDHFRLINETYGHSTGDEVLRSVSRTLHGSLRVVDILARFGGEEFVLLLPETGLNEALGVAGRLLYTLRATPAETSAGAIPVTMSVGVAGLVSENGITLDKLLERADKALYQSKKNGRNRVTVWVED